MRGPAPGPNPLLVAEDVPGGQGIHTIAAADVDGEVSVLIESLIDGGSEIWLGELQPADPSAGIRSIDSGPTLFRTDASVRRVNWREQECSQSSSTVRRRVTKKPSPL